MLNRSTQRKGTPLHTLYEISTTVKLERPEKLRTILRRLSFSLDRQSARLPEVGRPKNVENFYQERRKLADRNNIRRKQQTPWPSWTWLRNKQKNRVGHPLRTISTKLCTSISDSGVPVLYEKVVKLIKNPAISSTVLISGKIWQYRNGGFMKRDTLYIYSLRKYL